MTRFLILSAWGAACYAVLLGGIWAYSGKSPLPDLVQQFAALVLAIRGTITGG